MTYLVITSIERVSECVREREREREGERERERKHSTSVRFVRMRQKWNREEESA